MAYDFLSGSNRYFEASNQITSIGVPMTVSVREQYPNTTALRRVWSIYTTDGEVNGQYFCSNLSEGVTTINARSTVNGIAGVTLPGANQWFNALALLVSTTSRTMYVNTTSGTTSTDSSSITSETSIRIGAEARSGGTFTGQLAEFAIWNAALTADEINSLSQGFKPPRIRPQSLRYYVPLVRDVHELRSGITFTAVNAPVVFNHPRVY
jgi:hypothetical protein